MFLYLQERALKLQLMFEVPRPKGVGLHAADFVRNLLLSTTLGLPDAQQEAFYLRCWLEPFEMRVGHDATTLDRVLQSFVDSRGGERSVSDCERSAEALASAQELRGRGGGGGEGGGGGGEGGGGGVGGKSILKHGGGAGVGGAHPLLLYARCCSYISALQAQNPSGDAEGRFLEELAAFVDRHPPSSSAPAAALAHAEEVTKKDPGKARRRARFADDEGQ